LAEGLNKAERNPISHGEIDAIVHLSATRPEVDWTRLVLYTTVEPCPMYSGAILWCGIPRIVFGTSIQTLKRLGLPHIYLPAGEVHQRSARSGVRRALQGDGPVDECPVHSDGNNSSV